MKSRGVGRCFVWSYRSRNGRAPLAKMVDTTGMGLRGGGRVQYQPFGEAKKSAKAMASDGRAFWAKDGVYFGKSDTGRNGISDVVAPDMAVARALGPGREAQRAWKVHAAVVVTLGGVCGGMVISPGARVGYPPDARLVFPVGPSARRNDHPSVSTPALLSLSFANPENICLGPALPVPVPGRPRPK